MKIIFIHGSGTDKNAWNNTIETLKNRHKCFAVNFNDRFGDPAEQALELGKFLDQFKNDSFVLVAHSSGGLAARKYLADNFQSHKTLKLITIGTPNLGSFGMFFNYAPILVEIIASIIALATEKYFLFSIALLAAGLDYIFYLLGIKLLSKAASAIKPNSRFLQDLNSKPLPKDVEYISIVSKPWYHFFGDGLASCESQRLSAKCISNFKEIKYKEININCPRTQEPNAVDAISSVI
ncbi:MAG: hypothetical protein FD145_638 [Candidatus Saganbacteria bacterium]|uniref:AB hydrolase-1 domain-containing protein n=1 Tax=Candidatus Saganbacteria bacterium TaxID=2575572 RepID=A0A833NX61_UNCSA|nr:MAG: hypothetical protein FD145_638 [Candidatus Saganbacteria bacterium]